MKILDVYIIILPCILLLLLLSDDNTTLSFILTTPSPHHYLKSSNHYNYVRNIKMATSIENHILEEDGRNANSCNNVTLSHNNHKKVNTKNVAPSSSISSIATSRRSMLEKTTASITAATSLLLLSPSPSHANAELDAKSGELFTSKKQMLSGYGSDATRGVKIRNRPTDVISQRGQNLNIVNKKSKGLIQNVYNERFITYLSRFLLSFDPAAKSWWDGQQTTQEVKMTQQQQESRERIFADFAESVEVGLADYFLGPYGSYASLEAAKAGLYASSTATSSIAETNGRENKKPLNFFPKKFINDLFSKFSKKPPAPPPPPPKKKKRKKYSAPEKQGILNLLTLLQARYTSIEAKIQLVLLFSFLERSQPTQQISSLLGEIDDATIEDVVLVPNQSLDVLGGYDIDTANDMPIITVDPPQALGNQYKPTLVKPVMERSGRILRIDIKDPGEGYFLYQRTMGTPLKKTTSSSKQQRIADKKLLRSNKQQLPTITIIGKCTTPARAIPILSRDGEIDEIIILDPGSGYTDVPPIIRITPPPLNPAKPKNKYNCVAKAVAKLEYKITNVKIKQKGNGYIYSYNQLPSIKISKPYQYMDWVISEKQQAMERGGNVQFKVSRISSNRFNAPDGTKQQSQRQPYNENDDNTEVISNDIIESLQKDPTSLLPNSIRPKFQDNFYTLSDYLTTPSPSIPIRNKKTSYRAVDVLFGPISTIPVIKPAVSLSVSEYSRLALSGAICTVIVRTGLNPLELIKTKIQLNNDLELMDFVKNQTKTTALKTENNNKTTNKEGEESQPSTINIIKSLIELRGFPSLFQSADITFLASLVFGSFGFGATELFRRSFTNMYFDDGSGVGGGATATELIFLLAAALACVLTSFVASPFENIRVKSMSYIDAKGYKDVFMDFIQEQRKANTNLASIHTNSTTVVPNSSPMSNSSSSILNIIQNLQPEDIKPLFSAFPPIVSRELPFAIIKFLVFDFVAQITSSFYNSNQFFSTDTKVQVGVGTVGLAISAFSGALAGIAGAIVSHPADLILTLTSAAAAKKNKEESNAVIMEEDNSSTHISEKEKGLTMVASTTTASLESLLQQDNSTIVQTSMPRYDTEKKIGKHDSTSFPNNNTPPHFVNNDISNHNNTTSKTKSSEVDWREIVKELLQKENNAGILNLFVGLPARASFFFLVIGLQFFLYDYVKTLFEVGSDDLTLVLDVFYAVRQGLVDS